MAGGRAGAYPFKVAQPREFTVSTSRVRIVIGVVGVALAPLAARAQSPIVNVTLQAGPSIPLGSFGTSSTMGFHAGAGVGAYWPAAGAGLRLEALHDEFTLGGKYGVVCGSGSSCGRRSMITGAGVDAVLGGVAEPGSEPAAGFYVIGGVGYYDASTTSRVYPPVAQGNTTKYVEFGDQKGFGFNAGLGAQAPLSGFAVTFDARFYAISNAGVQFVPISLGVKF